MQLFVFKLFSFFFLKKTENRHWNCKSEWLEWLIKLFQLYVISCPVVVKDFIPNACCVGDEGSDVHQISLDTCTVSVIGSYYLVPELTFSTIIFYITPFQLKFVVLYL